MAVKINGINHCAISVADIEETIKWYQSGTSARSRFFVGSI